MFRRRTILIAFLFALAFGGEVYRLWQLQVTDSAYYREMGTQRQHRLKQLAPARGRILDRRGRVLAEDAASFELWFRPARYAGKGGQRKLTSCLGGVDADRLSDLMSALGKNRDLKYALALQSMIASDPLTARLSPLLQQPGESPQAARERVAKTLLDAALARGDSGAAGLTESRRCFSDISFTAWQEIERTQANPYKSNELDALETRLGYKRKYPFGNCLGHITGYVGNLTPDDYRMLRGRWLDDGALEPGAGEITKNGRPFFRVDRGSDEEEILKPKLVSRAGEEFRIKGYLANEMVGRGGIEEWYNDELRGRHIWRLEQMIKATPDGPRQFVESGQERRAVNGTDVYLTLDAEFQKKVTRIFDAELQRLSKMPEHRGALNRQQIGVFAGAAVVMNAKNGEIYALVSLPDFDPNTLSTEFSDLLKDRRKPLINRVIAGSYPPGSTLKPLVATGALEEGRITANTHFDCEGSEFLGVKEFVCMNRAHHGSIDVTDALKSSCNIFFYHAGAALGGQKLSGWLNTLGLGHQTGIDLPGERAGHLPAKALAGKGWSLGENYYLAIGQGAIDATPLQMAVGYAAIVNGGLILRPHLRYDPADPELSEPRQQIRLSDKTVKLVEYGMWKVVQWDTFPRGTAVETARIPGFEYMGKTGSAQKDRRDTHAWLVAAAPYKDPQIIVSVIVPFGNHGGSTCGVVVRKIVEAYFGLEDERAEREGEGALPEGDDASQNEDDNEPDNGVRPGTLGDPEDDEAQAPEGTVG